jgi:hypothetical protein
MPARRLRNIARPVPWRSISAANSSRALAGSLVQIGSQRRIAIKSAGQSATLSLVQRDAVEQPIGDGRQRLIVVGFGQIAVQIVIPLGIEQAQAGKVTTAAKLLGCGGEQDHAGNRRGEFFHHRIARASRLRRPRQVMRFVHHQQIPRRRQQLRGVFRRVLQKAEVGDNQLLVFERIAGLIGTVLAG